MLVLIRGAGDLASGAALRLHRANFPVVMTDLPQPTAIRRTVCFRRRSVSEKQRWKMWWACAAKRHAR